MKKILVIPSCRPESLRDFFLTWQDCGGWDEVVLVEDQGAKQYQGTWNRGPFHHYSHWEIAEELGDKSWIVSKKDSACRCFGFWKAWQLGADYVLTLDDDVRPTLQSMSVFDCHIANLTVSSKKWTSSEPGMRVRGLPYENLGIFPNVVVSMGLWNGVPDLDGPTSLTFKISNFEPTSRGVRLIPRGQYVPICGMNLCVKREAIPLCYFPLMGEGQPFNRFDDIWMGIIAKKICDHLNWGISVGEPFVKHEKASDPFVNLVKEAPGIAANEVFWEIIDKLNFSGETAAECMFSLGSSLYEASADLYQHLEIEVKEPLLSYLPKLGKAMQAWSGLFMGEELPL